MRPLGPLPDGPYRGTVTDWPLDLFARSWHKLRHPLHPYTWGRNRHLSALWQGKVFDAKAGTVVNRLFGREAITGRVTVEASQVDGQPCFVIVYPALPLVRDELRYASEGKLEGWMLVGRSVVARFELEKSP